MSSQWEEGGRDLQSWCLLSLLSINTTIVWSYRLASPQWGHLVKWRQNTDLGNKVWDYDWCVLIFFVKCLPKIGLAQHFADWPFCLRSHCKHSFQTFSKLHWFTSTDLFLHQEEVSLLRETLSTPALSSINNREFYIYPWLHMPFVEEGKASLFSLEVLYRKAKSDTEFQCASFKHTPCLSCIWS